MCAILQLVSASSNPRPIVDHFRRSHPLCELSYWTNVSIGKHYSNSCASATIGSKHCKHYSNSCASATIGSRHGEHYWKSCANTSIRARAKFSEQFKNFVEHICYPFCVSTICEKANKQEQVIKRFRNLIPKSTRSSTVSSFYTFYLSMLLRCVAFLRNPKQSDQKLELVNKKALRSVLGDMSST